MNMRRILTTVLAAVLVVLMGQVGHAQDRMPRIPAEQMTEEQKQAIAEFTRLRNSPVTGSFATLLRSPELMVRASAIGEFRPPERAACPSLRVRRADHGASPGPARHREDAHYQPAIAAGVATKLLGELVEGEKPTALTDDQRILWDLLDELHRYRIA